MNSLAYASIRELRKKLESKEISPKELLNFYLQRFARYDEQLGAALEVFDAESIIEDSNKQGRLYGIPGIIKDNIAQQGRKLTCASKILENYTAIYDATACKRLKNEGALLVGRANCDEFAMGTSNEYSAYQLTRNPWDLQRVPGGSSGGPIAAVAAGLVPWSLGSETGGSVRLPAAFCGIVGLKPTYGHISRYGLVSYASSLDQIGVATRTVYDNALVFSCIAGHDPKDSSCATVKAHDYTAQLQPTMPKGLTLGIVDNALNAQGMTPDVHKAIEEAIVQLEKLGVKTKKITLPTMDYSASVYFIVSRAEAASNLARFDGVRYGLRAPADALQQMYTKTRHDGFGTTVKTRILIGNYVLSTGYADKFYNNAKVVQNIMRQEVMQAFKEVDALVMPVHAAPAFKFGEFLGSQIQMDLIDYFTCHANLIGTPALSIPCGFTKENLPIGFQIVGPHFQEELLYKIAYAYEQNTDWHTKTPGEFC